jgi:hypothetical protein
VRQHGQSCEREFRERQTVGSNCPHLPEHPVLKLLETARNLWSGSRYAGKFQSVSFMTRIAYPAASGTLSFMVHQQYAAQSKAVERRWHRATGL